MKAETVLRKLLERHFSSNATGQPARLVVPAWRRPIAASLILGVIFVGIGLGQLTNWLVIGPLILLGIGVALLFSGLFRKRE